LVVSSLHTLQCVRRPHAAWDAVSAQHTVRYQDGTEAALWAGAERVRLAFSAGAPLPPPSAVQLRRLAAAYWRWGAAVEAWRDARAAGSGGGGGVGGEGEGVAYARPGSEEWVSGVRARRVGKLLTATALHRTKEKRESF
jgi:hypothetical protein